METLLQLLEMLGPTLVAILTVPLMGVFKRLVTFLDTLPAWAQQMITVVIAFGLTQLGAMTNMVLPEAFHLFGDADVAGLISAGMAFAIHAGQKAKLNAS